MQIQSPIYDLDLSLWLVKVCQAGEIIMIEDRDIPNSLRSAIKNIMDPDQTSEGIRQMNECHVAIYEACQVTRDLEMVIAHEIYTIAKTTDMNKIIVADNKKDTIRKTINSIRELTQTHIEYYS